MPKNTTPKGMRSSLIVLNSAGVWVNSKFAGLRICKNTRISDIQHFGAARVKTTHTSPIVRSPYNDGHNNPTRMRHAATKAAHAIRKMKGVSEEHSLCGGTSV